MRFKELRVHAKVPACGSAMAAESFRAAASATEQGGKIAASEWRDVGVVDAPYAGARGYGRPIDANADAAECVAMSETSGKCDQLGPLLLPL